MNTVEKRDFIHSRLHLLSDEAIDEVLGKMNQLLHEEPMSDELKLALDEGMESLRLGKSSSHKNVMDRMRDKYPGIVK